MAYDPSNYEGTDYGCEGSNAIASQLSAICALLFIVAVAAVILFG